MSETALYNLFLTLLCLVLFCVSILVFGGIVFLIIRVIGSQWTPLTAE